MRPLPVNEILSIFCDATNASPTSEPYPVITLITPSGNSSFTSSANFMTVSGAFVGGLMITVFLAAIAGAIL